MIWYLTYPVRRTVKPPVLNPGNPIRDAVENYAHSVASNPASFILLSITIGLVTCFLSFLNHASGSISGTLTLPGHAWTSTRALDHELVRPPDFTVKQAWVHGRSMSALEPDVLKQALIIQQTLLGLRDAAPTPVARNGPTLTMEAIIAPPLDLHTVTSRLSIPSPGPILHSPLQYWENSMSNLEADSDIARTINGKASQKSPFNITLRQPSLFAGKRYSKEGGLVAADAAIISFMFPYGSADSDTWDERADSLARSGRWDVFLPHDGQSIRAYEYKLSTVSRKDDIALAVAYLVMLSRIVLSLRKVQAIRSRYVLLPGVVSQNCLSITSAFAAMALLGLDYSRIPLEAYVFIVSMIGFDNALRLINAVLEAPAENSTNARVARALGSIAIHMTSPVERIVFLWLLAKVVSPLVASYCAFIAIAHMFDMFYHLAFFVPILCIDLQRLELQESIARQKSVSSSRSPILSSFDTANVDLWNKLPPTSKSKPLSNVRIAGTAVMMLFLLAMDWQCCSNQTVPRILRKTISLLQGNSRTSNATTDFWSELMESVRPSRSLTAWLYLQNQETAEEIMRVMKPKAHEFEAIIYDPLVIVLKGSNRSGAIGTPGVPSISLEHLTLSQLVTSTSFVVAGIAIAWMALRVWAPAHLGRSFPPNSSLKAIAFQEHEMDIVVMASSSHGMVITVSLDREVFLWDLRAPDNLTLTHSFILENEYWPVVAVSISDDCKWAIFCNYKGLISFWNCEQRGFESSIIVQPPFGQSSRFFYLPADIRSNISSRPQMALVRPSGWLSELTTKNHETIHHRVGSAPILSSVKLAASLPNISILSLATDKNVYITSKTAGVWHSRKVEINQWPTSSSPAISIATFPGLSTVYALLSASSNIACIIDTQTHTVIHSFHIMAFAPSTARGLFTSSHPCNRCGAISVASIALAYTDPQSKSLIMHTFAHSRNTPISFDKICLGRNPDAEESGICPAFESTEEQLHVIENVATWEQLDSHNLTGIRERTRPKPRLSKSSGSQNSEMHRRGGGGAQNRVMESSSSIDDGWEAWMMSIAGQSMSCQIDRSGQRTKLAVSTVGPAQKVGSRSVAVAFGNSVVILSAREEERPSRLGRRNAYEI